MRISDWSSDVCSSDLDGDDFLDLGDADLCRGRHRLVEVARGLAEDEVAALVGLPSLDDRQIGEDAAFEDIILSVEVFHFLALGDERSEAHTSELQSLLRISYAVFFLKKKNTHLTHHSLLQVRYTI